MTSRPDDRTEKSAVETEHAGRLALRVTGRHGEQTFPLPASGVVVVGRGEECDLRVDDPSISRRHASLHLRRGVEVEDLGSSNGTRVGGRRLAHGERVAVRPGELLELGRVLCAVTGPAPAPEPAPEPARPVEALVADPAMVALYALIDTVAPGEIHVLLLGETGVGKELVAERVHARSKRRAGPLLRLNCAAFTETLLEAEFFGYEKGAFTGAQSARPGLLESAEGGTVFLDEVGELSPSLQARLLRALEAREVRRVGALRARPIDVRFIAATNRDLEAEVAAGRFRRDLLFRLNGITLVIPPLRARVAEIVPLALRFAAGVSRGGVAPTLTPAALAQLTAHPWPGNVRELRNVMERAVLLAGDGPIGPEHLRVEAAAVTAPPPAVTSPPARAGVSRTTLDRERVSDALERCAGNQTRAAEALGVSRRTLVKWIARYGLPRPRKPSE